MENFTQAVESGLKLAKRISYSKDRSQAPPRPIDMERSPFSLRPTAPMVYAVIYDPAIVDNPDSPSYQPHVYGRMDPPSLIPLQMNKLEMEVECYLDSAVVTVKGSWRVHCVMASRSCECRLVVPMGEKGSLLGVELDVAKQSYSAHIMEIGEHDIVGKPTEEIGSFLRPHILSLVTPKVSGGSVLSLKIGWVQKLLYKEGDFSVLIPFRFPDFVNPLGKSPARKERIKLSVNSGTVKEVICQRTSHALKEIKRLPGSLFFTHEADVLTWSTIDFHFSYTVYSSSLFGGVLLQSPSVNDFDQREMFCMYLFPGNNKERKVFKKEIVFIIDISQSMRGRTLESTSNALSAAISKLSPEDSFNIIAFNDKTCTFSSSLVVATNQMVKDAAQWMNKSFAAGGGTNIIQPLKKALDMLSNSRDSIPYIFLITDGSVDDERAICSAMRTHMASKDAIAPRISTYGLGLYCNHYFLRMLATMSKGQYDAVFDADSLQERLQSLIERSLSSVLVDIVIDNFYDLDGLEVCPFPIPDLLNGCPLILSGRYHGQFPNSTKIKGILVDMTSFILEIKAEKTKGIPLDIILSRQQIDILTTQAWFSDSKQLEEKVKKLSIERNLPSEYCHMVLHEMGGGGDLASVQETRKSKLLKRPSTKERIVSFVEGLNLGFGNLTATAQNLPTGFGETREPETSAVLQKALGCCSNLTDCLCCMCCIRAFSRLNDQCCIAMTQLLTALSCLACFECCSLCCDDSS